MKSRHLQIIITVLVLIAASVTSFAGTCGTDMKIAEKTFSVEADIDTPVMLSDIGCVPIIREDFCASEQMGFDDTAMTVDFANGEALVLRDAFFVIESGIPTPMGTGVVAFGKKEDAQAFVAKSGKGSVIDYEGLLSSSFTYSESAK